MAKLYFSKGQESKKLSRRYKKKGYLQIKKGIYIDTNDENEIYKILESRWWEIADFIFDESVVVDRTAKELKPSNGRLYFVSEHYSARRIVEVGHLKFVLRPGDTSHGVEQFTIELGKSDTARMCLENLATTKGKNKRTLGRKWLEEELSRIIAQRGEDSLNAVRDKAREIAPYLELEKEFEILDKTISAVLNTHPSKGVLQTRIGMAQAEGEPYDQNRLDLFDAFYGYLQTLELSEKPYTFENSSWRHVSFFESYFSNYIEGTEFTIEEAEEIVFEGNYIPLRNEDSHDVSAHMEICSDVAEMKKTPSSTEEFLRILKVRHQLLLAERPNKRPGQFKEKANKAGGTTFVEPKNLEGTLVQGFEIYKKLKGGFKKAAFMHFLISECHPFDDGNGRLSRIMMNAELTLDDQIKIIIPTVHRDSYLNGLRKVSRESKFRTIIKVLHQMQAYSSSFQWEDYADVRDKIKLDAADKEPNEGVGRFNTVISKLGDDYPPG